jgi:iron complex outermembrane receptor protein
VRYVETFDTDPSVRYRQNLASVGAETDVALGRRFALSAGLGFDVAENPETGGRTEGRDPKDDWTGRVGITADAGATRLHAAISERSRFPSLRELYSGSLGRFTPNPALRPERLTVVEAGATVTAGALQVQGAVFRQVNEDGVIRITLENNRFMRVNRDEIRSAGFEGVGTWTRGGASIVGDLLVQRVRVHDITAANEANRPENVPEFRASAGAIVPLSGAMNANAWVTHSGTQYCSSGETEVDGGTRIDIGVDRSWRIARGLLRELKVLVSLDNVNDAAVYDQCGLPQPGRTLRAGVALR